MTDAESYSIKYIFHTFNANSWWQDAVVPGWQAVTSNMELINAGACLEGLPLVMYVGKAAEIFLLSTTVLMEKVQKQKELSQHVQHHLVYTGVPPLSASISHHASQPTFSLSLD